MYIRESNYKWDGTTDQLVKLKALTKSHKLNTTDDAHLRQSFQKYKKTKKSSSHLQTFYIQTTSRTVLIPKQK